MSRMYFTYALLVVPAPRADASRQYVGPGHRFSTFAPTEPRKGLRRAVADERTKPGRELLGAEGGRNARFDAVRGEERRSASGVEQDVVVTLVVTAPGAVVVADERRHLPDEAV